MNAANLNMQRKSMNKGSHSNTSKQRLGGSFAQPGGQFSSFQVPNQLNSFADVRKVVVSLLLGFKLDDQASYLSYNCEGISEEKQQLVSEIFGLKDEFGQWYFCPYNDVLWHQNTDRVSIEKLIPELNIKPRSSVQKIDLVLSCKISMHLFSTCFFDRLPDKFRNFDSSFFDGLFKR